MIRNIIFLLCATFVLSSCGTNTSDTTSIGESNIPSGIQEISQDIVGNGSRSIPEPGSFDPKVAGVNSYYPIMTPPPADTGANNSRDMLPSLPMLPTR